MGAGSFGSDKYSREELVAEIAASMVMSNAGIEQPLEIVYHKQAVKTLESMDAAMRQRICVGINGIPNGDIKKLKGHTELYRLRVGDWRIVFSYPDSETVLIEKIAPRGEIYKRV